MNWKRCVSDWLLPAAVAAVIFAIDAFIELGVAAAVLYVVVVWLAYSRGNPRGVVIAAGGCSLLTLAGLALSPPGGEILQVLANRGLALFAIWITALLCHRVLQLTQDQRQRAEAAEETAAELKVKAKASARKSRALASIAEDLRQERRRLRAETKERNRLSAIVESTEDAVVGKTLDGIVTNWNHGAETLYGYAAEEMIGQPIAQVVPDDRLDELSDIMDRLRRGQSVKHLETVRVDKSGTRRNVSLTISPIRDPAGSIVGASAIARDITERKAAESALRERDERITTLLDSTGEGIYGVDCEGNCIFANAASARLLGYDSPDKFLGRNMHDLIHYQRPDGSPYPNNECRIYLAFRENCGAHVDDELLWRKDGSSFEAEYWSNPVYKERALVGAVVTFVDITERKRLEGEQRKLHNDLEHRVEERTAELREANRALSESDTFFHLLVEQVWDYAIFRLDTKGRVSRWNEGAERLSGYTEQEILGHDFSVFYTPKDRSADRPGRELQTVCQAGRMEGECWRLRKDGSRYWANVVVTALRDEQQNLTGFIYIARDITKRQIAKQEMERMASVVRDSNDAVTVQELDGTITAWNRGAERLYGYSEQEMLGRNIAETIPEEVRFLADEMTQSIKEGKLIDSLETQRKTKDGRVLDIWLTVTALLDPEGLLRGVATTERDVTELKATHAKLQHANEELEEAIEAVTRSNAELDQFAYVASHDLKSPLRAIDSLAKWIVEDAGEDLPESCRAHLGKMQQRVQRMEKLLTDLLHYSRAGRILYEPEGVDTGQLVHEIIELVAKPEGFLITVADNMPTIETARPPLEHVFLNLVTNAIKHHNRPDGRIELSVRHRHEFYEFSVADDGPGIDPKFHERIFGMFQTLQPRDKVEGSGMGLAVIKKVVESYGGTIRVDSTAGCGTTFRFTWPTSHPSQTEAAQTEQLSQSPAWEPKQELMHVQ